MEEAVVRRRTGDRQLIAAGLAVHDDQLDPRKVGRRPTADGDGARVGGGRLKADHVTAGRATDHQTVAGHGQPRVERQRTDDRIAVGVIDRQHVVVARADHGQRSDLPRRSGPDLLLAQQDGHACRWGPAAA